MLYKIKSENVTALYACVCLLRGACECLDVVLEFPCTFITS